MSNQNSVVEENLVLENNLLTIPWLYESASDPPRSLDLQNIFSSLTKEEYYDSNYLNQDHSDTLFEKIYKDFCSTVKLTNEISDTKPFIISPIVNSVVSDESRKLYRFGNVFEKYQTILGNDEEKNNSALDFGSKVSITKLDDKKVVNNSFTKVSKKRSKKVFSLTPLVSSKKLNKTRYMKSPFITVRHRYIDDDSYGHSMTKHYFDIVNPALRSDGDHRNTVYRPRLKSFINNRFSLDTECVCAFCGYNSEFIELGSLYGPYFIDSDSVSALPWTCIFPLDIYQLRLMNTDEVLTDHRVGPDGEVWMHRDCVLWAPGTFLRGDGIIGGLGDALKMALYEECFVCHKLGAILNCTTKNCEKNFHYYCAQSVGSKLNEEQFSVVCNKHRPS